MVAYYSPGRGPGHRAQSNTACQARRLSQCATKRPPRDIPRLHASAEMRPVGEGLPSNRSTRQTRRSDFTDYLRGTHNETHLQDHRRRRGHIVAGRRRRRVMPIPAAAWARAWARAWVRHGLGMGSGMGPGMGPAWGGWVPAWGLDGRRRHGSRRCRPHGGAESRPEDHAGAGKRVEGLRDRRSSNRPTAMQAMRSQMQAQMQNQQPGADSADFIAQRDAMIKQHDANQAAHSCRAQGSVRRPDARAARHRRQGRGRDGRLPYGPLASDALSCSRSVRSSAALRQHPLARMFLRSPRPADRDNGRRVFFGAGLEIVLD